VPEDVEDIVKRGRGWLFLEPLQKLGIPFSSTQRLHRRQWSSAASIWTRPKRSPEISFLRQAVPRPEVRLAGRIKDRDGPVTIQLDFEDSIRGVKRRFCALGHHGRDEFREAFLRHLEESADKILPVSQEFGQFQIQWPWPSRKNRGV
jgi:hypothetical protein